MMRSTGAIDETVPVITVVSDCQIVDIPDELMEDHDFDVSFVNLSRNCFCLFIAYQVAMSTASLPSQSWSCPLCSLELAVFKSSFKKDC